jgi:hypothetical protein
MSEQPNKPRNIEELKAENDFLKMKLMLEHGAQFGGMEEGPSVPPEIENAFLKNIGEFEEQWAKVSYITVFDKIGRPTHFKPADEIEADEIKVAWQELSSLLNANGLELHVCSPNINERELYRFTIEELFRQETEDLNIDGMSTIFIYDEFHPDPLYENTRMVEEELFRDIFCKREVYNEIHYDKKGFLFNDKEYSSWLPFSQLINNFKSAFDEIDLVNIETTSCQVQDDECIVKGNYGATATATAGDTDFRGNFEIKLIKGDLEYWYFSTISIGGFDPH